MKKLSKSVVAITGAAGGIGRALAVLCAKSGANVAISDMNEAGLQETAVLCRQHGVIAHATVVDVADKEQVQAWADAVFAELGQVNMIVNNAGVNLNASVESSTYDDFEWLMNINFWGVVYGTKAFLPYLKKSEWGHIVNISSLFGLIGIPNQSAYNAAKFAVRGFSESLRMELEVEQSSVSVTCVHPGGVKTDIVNSARYSDRIGKDVSIETMQKQFNEKLARTTPESAAQQIVNAVSKNAPRLLIGTDAKILDRIQRIAPAAYQKVVVKALG